MTDRAKKLTVEDLMTTEVIVKQNEQKPVPVEVLAESIKSIAEGVRKMRAGPLNDRALYLLIQHACPSVGTYQAKKPGMAEVKAVIEGMASLEKAYLKKKP